MNSYFFFLKSNFHFCLTHFASHSYSALLGLFQNLQVPNFQSLKLLGSLNNTTRSSITQSPISNTRTFESSIIGTKRKMAQTLEGIKGGGGSIKLGTTGTISSLMTRELDQISSPASHKQVPSRTKPRTLPVSVACGSTTPKRLQSRKSSDEASSSSGGSNNTNQRNLVRAQKPKSNGRRNTHRIPILGSDNFPVDRSPAREKNDKKIPNIVEVVDIKCGNADKAWTTPLTSRLKKLGFSKLSESII